MQTFDGNAENGRFQAVAGPAILGSMKTLNTAILICGLLLSPTSWTKVEYDTNQLTVKNADQVAELVEKRILRARDIQAAQDDDSDPGFHVEPEALTELHNGLRIVLARSDQDGARRNLFGRLRSELLDLNSFETALALLTKEAIAGLRSSETPLPHQATYVVLLENLLAEIKPDLHRNPRLKRLAMEIRDAKLAISDALKKYQLLHAMASPVSPSETAIQALQTAPKLKPANADAETAGKTTAKNSESWTSRATTSPLERPPLLR